MKWYLNKSGELVDVTKVSSRGQVVIPMAMRVALKLNVGDYLHCRVHNGALILKAIKKKAGE